MDRLPELDPLQERAAWHRLPEPPADLEAAAEPPAPRWMFLPELDNLHKVNSRR